MEKRRLSDDDQAVQKALDYLKAQTAIPVTMYGEVKSPKKLQIVNWIGLRTPALENLEVVSAAGVGGRVMATRRPVGVSDYTRAKAISHEYDSLICDEGLHSLVAVPVIVSRSLRGVLYAGIHSRARLGDKVLEEVTMTARCLEQELAINAAMRERASGAPAQAASEGKAAEDAPKPSGSLNSAEWEQVRATHSKLRMLASRVEDETLRRDLEALCAQMVSPVRVKQTTKLSARELDVLSCVALGHTNVEAAEEMGIGAETVKSYLRSVMRKLGAHTRYEAVNAARRIGALP
ncbi:LuxR C-terminal-related transcriptional regulator [Corynebacterium sp.]|uniref:LuxR C-terminal-related transcriptional regulator n=1 Tax=Corynebacterium sp. TaxID=1720 RepID=UPI00263844CD|nr:LuxR C-terminal-related transcriptional regulator [Corynebacterium sp.]